MQIDLESLETRLRTLSYVNRLELLGILRRPRTLSEIDLKPTQAQARDNPDRTITRQAVQNHLERLVEHGMVRVTDGESRGRGARAYVVDHSALFALTEDLRELAGLEPLVALDPGRTLQLEGGHQAKDWRSGPKLVMVHGTQPGRAYDLDRKVLEGERGWVIGRGRDVHVDLSFDPYVSSEHAEVCVDDGTYTILDLRTSTNGTLLNWQPIPLGGEVELSHGDVIGVGRTLLLFRAD